MMQCQICGDTQGPFEIVDYNKRVVLACEDCADENKPKKIIKKKRRDKKICYSPFMQ